jgi:hypothetical protein
MVLGTGLFALLLVGAPQEPPIVPPSGSPGSGFSVFIGPVLGDGAGDEIYTDCEGPYEDRITDRTWLVEYKVNGSWFVRYHTKLR